MKIRVSDVASDSYCEASADFDRRLGRARTADVETRAAHGIRRHEDHAARSAAGDFSSTSSDRRCFIATAVYGPDAAQTEALRQFRDSWLRPHAPGRWLVALYYRASPPIARSLDRHPVAAAVIRHALDAIVAALARVRR